MGRKTIVWVFRDKNKWNFTREDLDIAKKRETEYLLIIAQTTP